MSSVPESIVVTEEPVEFPVAELMTGRGFITGKSGSGKSNTASVIAEELLEAQLPLLIVDTDGEYYGLKERYEILHAATDDRGDMTVGPDDAERLAGLALDGNVPIVLDVSGYVDPAEGETMIRRVLREIFRMEDARQKPFLLIVEEIHEYLPQSGAHGDLGELLIQIAKRGRKRGLGLCGISQRPAAVDKDFITQCDWLVWHRLTWENDTKVVKQILGGEAAATIQDLDDGEALLMTDWNDMTQQVTFRRKRTLDAGATPDLSDVAGGPDAALDIEVLEAIDAEVSDDTDTDSTEPATVSESAQAAGTELIEAREERIEALQARIDELESELRQVKASPAPTPAEPVRERPPEEPDTAAALTELGDLAAYTARWTRRRIRRAMAGLRTRLSGE